MMHAYTQPRVLTGTWTLVLLAPIAWAAALGSLFSMTGEACNRGSHGLMQLVAAACVLLALAPAPMAWERRRQIEAATAAGERQRFMLSVAAGGSLIFAIVTLLSAAPIFLLSACRT